MGYDDLYWFTNYNSSFGTEAQLRSLISTFKNKGIGTIADSGYFLAQNHAHRCAATRFPVELIERRRTGGMPPGCDCAAVLLAQKAPAQCRLYGTACTPQHPVGPCMVSDEGACRIWWSAGLRE